MKASNHSISRSHGTVTVAADPGRAAGLARKPDQVETIHFTVGQCSLGGVLVAQTDRGVCAILMGDDPEALAGDLRARFPQASVVAGGTDVGRLLEKVLRFIEAPGKGLELAVPLDVHGTQFQRRVWNALVEIPPGKTVSYTDIARQIGAPGSVRAVAQACGANSIAVVIPCHRVVRSDGDLSGYRWGVARKRILLEREGIRS